MESKGNLPIIHFATQDLWEEWLSAQHESASGLWLKIAKKGSGHPTVSYAEAVESALRFGWIDGQKGAYDEQFWLQRFTPRGPRSKWSQVNRGTATRLLEEGRMTPAGLARVEAAKADGRWEAAYEPQSRATVPDDLQRELDRNPAAAAFFSTLSAANRYAFLYRIQEAKKPETRARRIAHFVSMLEGGNTLHP